MDEFSMHSTDDLSHSLTSGIVVSSRVRLARNIADYPFVTACSDDQRHQIEAAIRSGIDRSGKLDDLKVIDSDQLELLERQFLMQLQMVTGLDSDASDALELDLETTNDIVELSQTLLPEENELQPNANSSLESTLEQRDEVFEKDLIRSVTPGGMSVTLNEEDHLRIQVTRVGLDLENAWTVANRLDDLIEQQLNFAFSQRWGYLTACPANVGTGMRVSVVLHLPALVTTGAAETMIRGLGRANVIGREMFGDLAGSDFFRISNQATLGHNESELIHHVTNVIPVIIKAEQDAREFLLTENRPALERETAFALQELFRIDLDDDSEQNRYEVTRLLSRVRMGIAMGLLGNTAADQVRQMFELVQLRHQLNVAISHEDYGRATNLRDRISTLEEILSDRSVSGHAPGDSMQGGSHDD